MVHALREQRRDTLLLVSTLGGAVSVTCVAVEVFMVGAITGRATTVDTLLPLLLLDVCGQLAYLLTAGAIATQVTTPHLLTAYRVLVGRLMHHTSPPNRVPCVGGEADG